MVETKTAKFVCEVKSAAEMADAQVLAKARAAAQWCQHATEHGKTHGGKPWTYLLIPHDVVTDNKTLGGLAAAHTFKGNASNLALRDGQVVRRKAKGR